MREMTTKDYQKLVLFNMATPLQKLLYTINSIEPFDIPSKRVIWIIEQLLEEEKQILTDAYFAGFKEGRGIDKIDVTGMIFPEDTNAERYYSTLSQPNESHYPKEI